jgi:hypothetical protein
MSMPDNGDHVNAILHKIGLPPVVQMTEEQRDELRTALGLPTRNQLSQLTTRLKALRDQGASAPKVKPLTITEEQRAALKCWLGLPVQTARRVSQLEEKDAKRSERARLITQGNRFREAIFQILRRDGAASMSNRDAWDKFSASDFSTMITIGGFEYKVHADRRRQIVQRNTSNGTETAIGRRTFEKYMTLVRHAPNKAP